MHLIEISTSGWGGKPKYYFSVFQFEFWFTLMLDVLNAQKISNKAYIKFLLIEHTFKQREKINHKLFVSPIQSAKSRCKHLHIGEDWVVIELQRLRSHPTEGKGVIFSAHVMDKISVQFSWEPKVSNFHDIVASNKDISCW